MKTVQDEVYEALRVDVGQTPAQIARQVEYGSLISVRHALRELAKEKRCWHEGEDMFRIYYKVEMSDDNLA